MEKSGDAPPSDSDAASPERLNKPDLPAVAEALSAHVREALERGDPAEVPGLGTFRVEHQPSQTRELEGGRFSISPPRDAVVFEPASQ